MMQVLRLYFCNYLNMTIYVIMCCLMAKSKMKPPLQMEREAKNDGRRRAEEWLGFGGMMHTCPHCAYTTANITQVWKHISSMHTGEKPFLCPYCPYRTTRNALLKEHINTHTGERPFSCPYCPYNSSHRNILKRHIRTHTGEKPYTCNLCSYRAASKTNLNSHLLTHMRHNQ